MDDDGGAEGAGERTVVDGWLEPLSGDACGEDLEYDNDFLELSQAAVGKPETQFAPAEPPDWRVVADKATSLFDRTRDLRVAIFWMRSQVVSFGWGSLPDGLRLVQGLLENFWDELHPRPDPDDGDAYARINALSALNESEGGLLGDLRGASILRSRSIGELRGRDAAIALERLEARDDESPPSREQIERMLADAVAEDPTLRDLASSARARLKAIGELMRERVGYDRAPTFDALDGALSDLERLMPDGATGEASSSDDALGDGSSEDGQSRSTRGGAGLGDTIDSRDDALRAIDMVCDYLERTEPTNPAQLLLRRAQRLVNKNFLELVRELAPDALAEVARVMGVSPDTIAGDGE